ncbi:hypothetical protein [Acidithiobacillus ferriphilus]|uniref:hypothetical protein n=1 Tax=Acidithiobacillus ferriphilus TaxID=1689834 RepID=UPI002DBBC808|nr:hypothetical protein [Acidithiobacillus ferriphilus]MEB8474250.1 hypothetical protein [Acidithiobacillus ferriphilus]
MTITIKTHLNSGIYESSGGGETRTHYAFATGPRNLLKAIILLGEHRSDMERSYGNIGCGSSWLEIDGQRIHQFDLQDVARDDAAIFQRNEYTHIQLKNRTTKANELIVEVQSSGGYDFNKYDRSTK